MSIDKLLCDQACKNLIEFDANRYLISNSHGRQDGSEKALRHSLMCRAYAGLAVRVPADRVNTLSNIYKAIHTATQEQLTDRLDETIGFPLDGRPDYDKLVPLFIDRFHEIAMASLHTFLGYGTEHPEGSEGVSVEDLARLKKEGVLLRQENRHLRNLLFLQHGSAEHYLYGDDGERHCNTCGIDFNNDSPREIDGKIRDYNLRKFKRELDARERDIPF